MLRLKVQKMGAGYRSLLTQELSNFEDTCTLCSISEYVIADREEHLVMLNGLFCIDPEKPTPGSSAIALAVLISVNCLTCYFQYIYLHFFNILNWK